MLEQIRAKLTERLKPESLRLDDESGAHVGHTGHDGGPLTHLGITVVSGAFAGKSRVDRHRMVYDCVKDEMQNGLHAITRVETYTPEEYAVKKQVG